MTRLFRQSLKLMDESMDLRRVSNVPLEQDNTANEVVPNQHLYILTRFITMESKDKVLSNLAL